MGVICGYIEVIYDINTVNQDEANAVFKLIFN